MCTFERSHLTSSCVPTHTYTYTHTNIQIHTHTNTHIHTRRYGMIIPKARVEWG